MPNPYFRFKQFTVYHDRCAMKVTTDACLFGAWVAREAGFPQSAVDREGLEDKGRQLLDIGAGTGLLSLMVAQKNCADLEAIEINAAAAEQAKENITASPWEKNIRIINEDVLRWQTEKRYDCIFSNPPFYQNELKGSTTQKNVAHHDEGLTLDELFRFINNHLAAEGTFFLLLPAKREKEVDGLFEQNGLFLQQKVLVQQTLKHPPFRLMIQGCRKKLHEAKESTLSIKGSGDSYTPAFVALLKDYYLFL